jgi:hypothetical protein
VRSGLTDSGRELAQHLVDLSVPTLLRSPNRRTDPPQEFRKWSTLAYGRRHRKESARTGEPHRSPFNNRPRRYTKSVHILLWTVEDRGKPTMVLFRRLIAVGLAVGVLLTLSGCSKLQKIQSAMSSARSMATADIAQWTADKMTQALAAINTKIGADPADYVEVLVNEYFLRVEAIDPHKRENVDAYTFQGSSVEVKPVDVSRNGPGAVEASAFKGDTVKPAVLAQTMASAPKDSGVENATVEFVLVKKFMANHNEPEIQIEAKGPRGSKIVHYDLTGKLLNVSQG